ncbi:MAG: tetratricopeptide repeat protein [Bacteroidota bacterium]
MRTTTLFTLIGLLLLAATFTACGDASLNEANKMAVEEKDAPAKTKVLARRYFEEGTQYMRAEKFEKAITAFSKSIEQDPNHADTYFNRASVYAHMHKHEAAIDDYSSVVNLKPNDTEAYLQRGYHKLKTKDFTGAQADFDQVIDMKPTHGYALFSRGLAKKGLKDQAGACSDFSRAQELGIQRAEEQIEANCNRPKKDDA